MKARVIDIVRQDRGNAAILMIGLLSIMMVLFIFVFNLSKIFAVKEEANTTAQQASLAATSVLYSQVDEVINDYEAALIGTVDKLPESIGKKIQKKEFELQSDSSYDDYSDNEIELEALDIVLTEELQRGVGKDQLHDMLNIELYETIKEMEAQAQTTIIQNNGNLSGATLVVDDGQVFVRASNTVEGTSFKGFFTDLKEDLFQTAGGPKVDFLTELSKFDVKIERSLD
ncbi:Tad domain-containing protein [Bacillus haikouensis]|uniref:TadE/TadG family type IV pilus assembly protein n=1 Tax=Bacillus haikouensis TaxID=1510468 RepID=UPI0015559602|nr:pilus assembly protein TadG-related protein [Bacillus haikouensis]NQD66197.1 Tad domain-containing protein [Bacillus haikouensis]